MSDADWAEGQESGYESGYAEGKENVQDAILDWAVSRRDSLSQAMIAEIEAIIGRRLPEEQK